MKSHRFVQRPILTMKGPKQSTSIEKKKAVVQSQDSWREIYMWLFEKSTYLQEWSSVKSWIAATLVPKNTLNLQDSGCIQSSTVDAVSNIISSMAMFSSCLRNLPSLSLVNAAQSSRRGIDSCCLGVTEGDMDLSVLLNGEISHQSLGNLWCITEHMQAKFWCLHINVGRDIASGKLEVTEVRQLLLPHVPLLQQVCGKVWFITIP